MTPRLVRPASAGPVPPCTRRVRGHLLGTPLWGVLLLLGCNEGATVPTPTPPVERVPTTVDLSADEVLLSFIGGTGGVTARVLDQDGEPMAGEEILWFIPDESVATVDTAGLITARSEGVTELIVTSGALTATAAVDVRTGWIQVAAGREHACGLWGHGVPFCWGDNGFGQLGLGTPTGTDSPVPAQVATDVLFDEIAAGEGHSCGRAVSGDLLCWGWNAVGQLGTGDVASRDFPTPVESDRRFVQLSAGSFHNCAVTDDGTALCWGGGGREDDGRDLAMGFEPPDVCSPPGSFFSDRCSWTPRPVSGDIEFARVSAGLFHTCGIGTDDRSWCWGWNRGQLGNGEYHPGDPGGTEPGYASPVLVDGALTLVGISAGNVHTCGVTAAGQAWCWGEEDFQTGALGSGDVVGSSVPIRVDGGTAFPTVDAAAMNSIYNQFTCGLDDGGSAWCWGANRRGQLGATSFDSCAVEAGQVPCSVSPVRVNSGVTFEEVAAGLEFACALSGDEAIWCWGANDRGQLGNGGGVDRATPVRVADPPPIGGADAS